MTAVAHPKTETVWARKEGGEFIAGAGIEQNGFGPAFAGAQHVAVGKTATGGDAMEINQRNPPSDEVAHVDIHRGKTSSVEGRRHLHLAVDALFAQDGDSRSRPFGEERRGDVLGGIKGQPDVQPRIRGVAGRCERLASAIGMVAQRLHPVTGFRPQPPQFSAAGGEYDLASIADNQPVLAIWGADGMAAFAQAGGGQPRQHEATISRPHLEHRAQFFGEQRAQGTVVQIVEQYRRAAAAGEHHLGQRRQQTTIGPVVVGQQSACRVQFLNHGEECLQIVRRIHVGNGVAPLVVNLGQRRAAQAILAAPEINENQVTIAPVGAQLRRQGPAHILNRREGGYDQRQRRDHALARTVGLPNRFHGQRILADRNGDAQRRAQFHPHRFDGIEQARVLAGMARCRHPIGRQLHIAQLLDPGGGDVGDCFANRHSPGSRRV